MAERSSNRKPREGKPGKKDLSIRGAADRSHARDPYSDEQKRQLLCCTTVEQKVELLCAWMVRGWYQPGGWAALARVWEVSERHVQQYAAEARRMLSRELLSQSRDELLAELLARLSFLGEEARTRTEEALTMSGDVVTVRRPDVRAAIRAAEAQGELLGLKVQRHHHVHAGELTTEQIVEQLEKHGVQVKLPALTTTAEEVTEDNGDNNDSA